MKFIKYILVTLVAIYFLTGFGDLIYSNSLKEKALFSGEVQEWNRVNQGKIDVDLAVFGSSRAMIHINPQILEDSLHMKTHNLGLNGSKFKMQYYRFLKYLDNNPHPKTIVWNLDTFSFSHIDEVFQPNQYVPFMLWNYKLYTYLKEYENADWKDYLIPFYRYEDRKYWQDEIKKAEKETVDKNGYFRQKGFKSYNRKWNVNWATLKAKDAEFDADVYPLIENLIKRCQQENIQLIFTIAPEFYKGQDYMLNRNEIVERYKKTLKQYDLPLLDYSKDSISYQQKWFYNTTHLNDKGADEFTRKLARDLQILMH
ncbi:hypothetical protein [Faecalibacter rhinopitheci]|uniref:SGNH/GDSL hydrolase family protein n=1 Tax=Faecalibacter rhinopitheci TaxID=2779678 RepID=A0A8J7FW17_9FLAO|nr:hypothetical protein [Faecalibacter rhinopitheci]MBF0596553.1 hypothetical protein [Faecalibacter rhinopitheci]